MYTPCVVLISYHQLGELATEAKQQLKKLSEPITGSKRREDLVDAAKWSLGDLALFGRTLLAFSKDLTELKAARDKERQLVKELRASMLKGTLHFQCPSDVTDHLCSEHSQGGDHSLQQGSV